MRWIRYRAATTVAAVVAVTGLVSAVLAGCGQAKHVPAPATPQLRSPFTGEPVRSLNRVLAVKIDNIVYARP